MGSSSAKGPKTEKATKDGKNGFLRFGLCEMQGWRNNMVLYYLKPGRRFDLDNRRRKELLPFRNFRWARRYVFL